MKRMIFAAVLCLMATAALAAEAVAPAAAPSFQSWLMANTTPMLVLALGVSELLGSSPWLKGNGIIDTIVKFLKFMTEKEAQ
jgi:hypothetical protein